jgi:hypothetical protein
MLAVASCNSDTTLVGTNSLGSTFTLRIGQSVILQPGNMRIGFRRVTGDSRCPSDARCFWEGMAFLDVWLLQPHSDTVFIRPAIRGYVMQADTCCQEHVDTLGYRVKLVQLDPYPGPGNPYPIPATDYLAYLQVSKP